MKEIQFTNTKPKYWFGDRTIIAIGLGDELATVETIYGIKYCLDSNDWMYCFVLGQTPKTGHIWFSEWELDDFKENCTVKPQPSSYPSSASNEDWEQISF